MNEVNKDIYNSIFDFTEPVRKDLSPSLGLIPNDLYLVDELLRELDPELEILIKP